MPKTPSPKLFNLIKSLTGSEKRYFKIFAQGDSGKSNKYLELFDAIDRQKKFDEEALKRQVYQGKPIKSRKYSELKNYLYESILRSLQQFDEQTSYDFRLKSLLRSVRVLHKRALFEDCRKELQKARSLAEKYEAFESLLEILNWEKKIAYANMEVDYLDENLDRIAREEQDYLAKLQNLSEYQDIFFRLLTSIRKYASLRDEKKIAGIKDLIDHPLLQDTSWAKSRQARILYHRIWANYHYSVGDHLPFYQTNKKLLALIESYPLLLEEDVSEYISVLSNFTLSCGLLEKYGEVEKALEKFLNIKPKTLDDELKIHRQYYNGKFLLCIFTGDFEEGLKAFREHQKQLPRFDKKFFERGSFLFQYFYIHFGAGNYDRALDYLNQWLNLPKTASRQDLQSIARILNLMVHYEMGNELLLEYLLRSTYRFLKKRNTLFEFEKSVLEFVRESFKIRSRKELRDAFVRLKESFESLKEKPSEKIIFQYFDFVSWLESKIRNRPFAEIVKEKYVLNKEL